MLVRKNVLGLVLTCVVAMGGCTPAEGGNESGAGASGMSGDGDGDVGGDGDGDAPMGRCPDPLQQALVFSPRDLSDGSVIYKIVHDDGMLYFSTVDRLFRVNAQGGEPEELYHRANAIVVQFWVRESDILIVEGTNDFLSLPKAGGATSPAGEVPFAIEGGLSGSLDLIVVSDELAYAKSSSRYYEIDLNTFDTRAIMAEPLGNQSSFFKAGDALYVVDRDPSAAVPSDPTAFVPELLYRLPIEGTAAEVVAIDQPPQRMNLVGARGDALYILARGEQLRTTLYRVPAAGGAREEVLFAGYTPNTQLVHGETRLFARDLNEYWELPETGPAGDSICIAGSEYTTHAAAATDSDLWFGLYHSADEQAFIVRYPLQAGRTN